MADSLGKKRNSNVNIWKPLMSDLEEEIRFGNVSNQEIYVLIRALYAIGLTEPQAVSKLVDYIVKRGYDSDDLLKMKTEDKNYR